MREWVVTLRGEEVVFTGDFRSSLGLQRDELKRIVRRHGGRVSDDVRRTTDVLVRGHSPLWKYRDFGEREAEVATLQMRGYDVVIIDSKGFAALLDGLPAPVIRPHRPRPRRRYGAPYRPTAPDIDISKSDVFERDPNKLDRSLRAHARTQEALADAVREAGFEPASSFEKECDFDIAWKVDNTVFVAEVKSLSAANETLQLRLGLGQVLDYANRLRTQRWTVRAVLAVERQPTDLRWVAVCATADVLLTWPSKFRSLF